MLLVSDSMRTLASHIDKRGSPSWVSEESELSARSLFTMFYKLTLECESSDAKARVD
jgi:hypothetical protein